MKRLTIGLLVAALAFALAGKAAAAGSAADALRAALPEEAAELLEGAEVEDAAGGESVLRELLRHAAAMGGDAVREACSGAAAVLLASLLAAVAAAFYAGKGEGAGVITAAGVAAVGALSLGAAGKFIRLAADTAEALQVFAAALIPTLAASAAAGGAVTAAAAKHAASMLFTGLLTSAGEQVIMPLLAMYLALSAAASVFGGGAAGAATLIRRAVTVSLTAVAMAFTLYLTLSGTAAAAADASAVKLARAAVSGALPVVGRIVADAAESVLAGAALLRTGTGVFGMLAVAAVCAAPFLRLLAASLAYRAAGALAAAVAPPGVASFIDAVGTALTLALAFVGTEAVMLFLAIVSFMKTAV